MKKYIVTGCDKNTEWQLPWFVKNFKKHCQENVRDKELQLVIADFGMTTDAYMMAQIDADYVIDAPHQGWFSKVETMWKMMSFFGEDSMFCWLDTDCEIRENIKGIFNFVEQGKLTMVVDHPWTENGSPWTPQGRFSPWFNSGVFAFQGQPNILRQWKEEVRNTERHRGDQEALYWILNRSELNKTIHIAEAPHRYNVLRLDLEQNRVPSEPVIVHWTGRKGKEVIKEQLRG